MRVLHIGAGYRPLRRGGLIAYVEDLMQEQAQRGYEVSYLFSGRYFPLLSGPRLRRWRRGGVTMLEIVNSPLDDHGRQPELEVGEPRVERIVSELLAERRPDVVHVQELAGLPSSVVDLAHDMGVPVVVTLQDYFPVCPTFKLLDANGGSCVHHDAGEGCLANVLAHDQPPNLLYEISVIHALARRLPFGLAVVLGRVLARWSGRRGRRALADRPRAVAAYRRRRELNVARLNRADVILAMSNRVSELYRQVGVDSERLRTIQLTLAHLERLHPRRVTPGSPITFATLGGGEGDAKGAGLLLEAARTLADLAETGRFRILLCGYVAPEVAERARGVPGIEIGGRTGQISSTNYSNRWTSASCRRSGRRPTGTRAWSSSPKEFP